ncbi:winged helix-turn-helix domain-containing protein [Phosphitispora fastidiosa]|uniref:winged helix-turn-helix domain-containing protein n=1 Tax=Phosphitispora fastidiosa TaxID=2837202 RepID=UPI001E2E88D0|nr:LysR family transcriptional regulator [Phosphitispora fastidiosa]MBU7006603.1 molybdate transport system regulatory protein [Phosphitispora fastidiosa]
MDFKLKIWLEKDEQPVFGRGLLCLLTLIRQHGSIRRAAEDLGMSYRQAWGSIKKAESRLGVKLLIKHVGGESGGGAQLTDEARQLMLKYGDFMRDAEEAVKLVYARYFEQ